MLYIKYHTSHQCLGLLYCKDFAVLLCKSQKNESVDYLWSFTGANIIAYNEGQSCQCKKRVIGIS